LERADVSGLFAGGADLKAQVSTHPADTFSYKEQGGGALRESARNVHA
jgi:hypothetical protein